MYHNQITVEAKVMVKHHETIRVAGRKWKDILRL